MIKEYITPINIIFILWGLILQTISWFYPDYTRYYLYLSIIVLIPFTVFKMIKQRKEDKLNDTREFQASIYRMLIMAAVLVVFYFLTHQKHI
jgi:predicted permease